ncbi:MAG TPA: hypothetical protein VE570_14340 [Thermoleophilaceae bacterium]|nr:hypothetical protein [Thermoleophilaceae bacterium]
MLPNQIYELPVVLDKTADVGAEGKDFQAALTRGTQRRGYQFVGESSTLEPLVELRVQKRDGSGSQDIRRKAGEFAIDPDLESPVLGIVPDLGGVGGRSHDRSGGNSRRLIEGVSSNCLNCLSMPSAKADQRGEAGQRTRARLTAARR